MTIKGRYFLRGFICALACLARMHGNTPVSRDLLECCGAVEDVERYGAPSDVKDLRKAGLIPAARRGRKPRPK